ncbi:uncharacterized protein KNAG_0D02680 [Huiozyma naganishii CBS 8797]|uniref:Retrovirus-related Pol polyprotein from transposon TNT 1-94-like beta-barrel domain-containing protein n=1 Tax=Huiozyma naganishii (strain ATCC MYA-139 / BCRC 22969 / CBS 8797 / KCTC 17520 / NBRC 10181 / NCYC 3082 / Yp74L-3) TaxID=1071383 RepID=J7RY30_HUIN7|nr:hypothetical protein KNAG_0D02680 [Kazachstania naganishii CBS 8797]CCK70017.1 hypothetical protein KNAG_0D02680 [Kazachstania naganishii CBS 8797]
MAAKRSTYHSQIKCFHCGENHPISKCVKYKRDYPDANTFRSNEKIGGLQSFYASMYASTSLPKGELVVDSGSSIHVCNDASMFSELKMGKHEELTGIVGNATIEGFGKVKVKNFLLHNVAYVPGVDFKLISISAATATSKGRFIFGKIPLQMITQDGVRSTMAKQRNGLYTLKSHRGNSQKRAYRSFDPCTGKGNSRKRVYRTFGACTGKVYSSNQVKFEELNFPLKNYSYIHDVQSYAISTLRGVSASQEIFQLVPDVNTSMGEDKSGGLSEYFVMGRMRN